MQPTATLDTQSQRLARILEDVCRTIAARAGRDRAVAPLVLLLWRYLRRLARRFEATVARLGHTQTTQKPRPATQSPRPAKLPEGFAWLIRLAPETAAFGSQLRHLLTEPEMAALIAASPRVGRCLRPLCRMLGIEPALVEFNRPKSQPPSAPSAVPPNEPTAHEPGHPAGLASPRRQSSQPAPA